MIYRFFSWTRRPRHAVLSFLAPVEAISPPTGNFELIDYYNIEITGRKTKYGYIRAVYLINISKLEIFSVVQMN